MYECLWCLDHTFSYMIVKIVVRDRMKDAKLKMIKRRRLSIHSCVLCKIKQNVYVFLNIKLDICMS